MDKPQADPAGVLAIRSLGVSETNADVRMDGVYFFRSSATYPFEKVLEPGNFSYCFMVRRGTLRLTVDFPAPQSIDLAAGDIAGISGLASHLMHSIPRTVGLETGRFERVSIADRIDPDRDVELLIGVAPSESIALSNMILGPVYLSRSTTPECAQRIWRAAELLEEEFQGAGQEYNQDIIVRRIAEIILINMTRSILMRQGPDRSPLPRIGSNSGVLVAVQKFLATPLDNWTVDRLARAAGMSRTRFAQEFRRMTGRTPIQTLARIRLTMMARMLLTEQISVDEAADVAGYSSSAAFIRAFSREFGATPYQWRKLQNHRLPVD